MKQVKKGIRSLTVSFRPSIASGHKCTEDYEGIVVIRFQRCILSGSQMFRFPAHRQAGLNMTLLWCKVPKSLSSWALAKELGCQKPKRIIDK